MTAECAVWGDAHGWNIGYVAGWLMACCEYCRGALWWVWCWKAGLLVGWLRVARCWVLRYRPCVADGSVCSLRDWVPALVGVWLGVGWCFENCTVDASI